VKEVEIHYLTKFKYKQILEGNPYIDKLWLYDNNLKELIRELKFTHFDFIIDLHRNLRTERIKRQLSLVSFSFNKLNFEKWLMVNFKKNRLPDKHIVDRYMDTLKVFDVANDGGGLDYFIDEIKDKPSINVLKKLPPEYIAMAIGAQHFTKKMPSDQLAALCNLLKLPIVLLGGKSDEKAATEILLQSRKKKILDLTGKISLNSSAWIVKNSKFVISHDTGIMHIAAAFKKKIISLWGNTIPEFGMYPYLPDPASRIFEVNGLSCRPCSKIGFSECPKKHFKCMKNQDIIAIADFANSLSG
jgi:ADP-heptose:LPS heptosyltransferase